MNIDNIITFIVAYIPVVVACFGEVVAFLATIKQYKLLTGKYTELMASVKDRSELNALVEEIKAQSAAVMHENAELKRQIAELISKIDKVKTITTKEG